MGSAPLTPKRKTKKGNKKENALKSANSQIRGRGKITHSFRLAWGQLEKGKSTDEVMPGCVYETGDGMLAGHLNQMEIRRVPGVGHHRWKQVVEELKDPTLRQKRPKENFISCCNIRRYWFDKGD